jgi:tRNA dimethylallyltransferase
MNTRTCIIIVGPTAVGKTSFALQLAHHFNTSIISADSRQCFVELNIGVAKPSDAELKSVKHYFINSHHIHEEFNAALFEKLSLLWIEKIFLQRNVAIMVGGTGLYVKAFAEGLDDLPPTDPDVRKKIASLYEANGMQWLRDELLLNDPQFASKGEMQNPRRMMRALEVKIISGKSIFSFRSLKERNRPFRLIKIGLEVPREVLYERINQRVDVMMKNGLLEEAKTLYPFRKLNALQTVGYQELFEYLDGKISLDAAVDLIKQNTRHYAKRQLTWFKRDNSIFWLNPVQMPATTEFVENLVSRPVDQGQQKFTD